MRVQRVQAGLPKKRIGAEVAAWEKSEAKLSAERRSGLSASQQWAADEKRAGLRRKRQAGVAEGLRRRGRA